MAAERGNALFIILLGIVLFAALTAAITGSFRGGNSALSNTRIEALASDVIMTAAGVEKAVGKLLAKDNSERRISFNRNVGDGYELTPSSSVSEKVFHISGGGSQYLPPHEDMLSERFPNDTDYSYGDWLFTGHMEVPGIGTASTGELLAILPYLREDLCIAVNKRLGIDVSPPPEAPAISLGHFSNKYTGSYNITMIQDSGGVNEGKKAMCMKTSDGKYFFYYVLHAR